MISGELPANRSVARDGELTIMKAKTADSGFYICTASNVLGTRKATTVMNVLSLPKFITKPPANLTAGKGDTVRVNCRATGSRRVVLTWRREGKSLPFGRAIQQSGVLTIWNAHPKDSGKYICTAVEHYAFVKVQDETVMSLTVEGIGVYYLLTTYLRTYYIT